MQGLLDLPAALDDDHQRDAELTTRTARLLVTVGEETGRLGAIDDDADIGVLVFVTEQIRDEMRENTAAGLQPAVTLLDRPYSASSTEAASVGTVADSWSQSLDLGPADRRDAELTTRTARLLATAGEDAGRLGTIDDADIGVLVSALTTGTHVYPFALAQARSLRLDLTDDIPGLLFVTEQIRDEMRENTAAGLQPAVTLLDRPYSASSTEAASVGTVADSWSQSLDLGPAGLFRLTHSASTTADSGCGITAFSEDEESLRRVTATTDLATGDPSQALQLP